MQSLRSSPQPLGLRCLLACGLIALLSCVGAVETVISPALTASRTSGPAPLAVHFDASGTTATGVAMPFHELLYEFDFADERGQNWSISGLPKNVQRGGPIAAHVFDVPGTYVVIVRVLDANGMVAQRSITVTAQDPNVVFSGTNTICVSTAGNFTGSPAGASLQRALPSSYAGKRVLLRRGESFAAITPLQTDSGFQVGAFGSGAKPLVAGVGTGRPGTGAVVTSDWTAMDLDIGTGTVSIDASTTRFLLYRNDIVRFTGTESMVNIGTAGGYYYENGFPTLAFPREVFIVENTIRGVVTADSSTSPIMVMMGSFLRSAILGNSLDRAHEHTMRLWAASQTIIAHNAMGGNHHPDVGSVGIRHALKIHSDGLQPFADRIADSRHPMTSRIIVASNTFGSTTYPGSWLTAFGPQNSESAEGLEDIISENNTFIRGPNQTLEIVLRGRRMDCRGNTLEGGGTAIAERIGHTYPAALSAWDGPYLLSGAVPRPVIHVQPAGVLAALGQRPVLSVTASGAGPRRLTYQWRRNGVVIAGATSASYTLPAAALTDNGAVFSVIVTNSAGSTTSANALLTVSGTSMAPTITSQPAAQRVTVGQTATFTVAATGTPAPTFQWRKNGANIVGATAASYTTPTTVIGDNGALFSVIVSNSAGSATSSNATLTVSATTVAPTISTQPENRSVIVGQTATFTVVATGTPTPTFQWRKNGANIVGATAASYTTPTTVIGDNGALFRVVVTNSAGSTSSTNATLTVTTVVGPPPITTPPAPTVSGSDPAQPVLSGTTEAGATVTIFVDGVAVGTVVANGSGQWTWTPSTPLTPGTHAITVTATNAANTTSAPSAASTVTVPSGSAPVDNGTSSGGSCGLGSGLAALAGLLMPLGLARLRRC